MVRVINGLLIVAVLLTVSVYDQKQRIVENGVWIKLWVLPDAIVTLIVLLAQ